jgi:diguanylate cyclase (GGDEF)-like protein
MKVDNKVLEIISNETKENIEELDVVTPSIYTSIFSKHATSHDADLKNEDKITDHFLDKKISMFENIQDKTSQNAITLSEHTDRAISAIQDKDETTLKEVLHETQELKKEIEKLKEYLYKDELTNTFNRKWIQDNLLKSESKKLKQNGTLAIIDLNYFKTVNDTYGHIVGDKVLLFVANQLKEMRENVIRFGGDEFIVIFSKNIKKDIAHSKLYNLREEVIKKKLKSKNSSFKVSFSFGITEFNEDDTLGDVIESADKNMYNDKIEIKKRITGIY